MSDFNLIMSDESIPVELKEEALTILEKQKETEVNETIKTCLVKHL